MQQYIFFKVFEQYRDYSLSDEAEVGRVERYSISMIYENDVTRFMDDLYQFLTSNHRYFELERQSFENIHYINIFFVMGFEDKVEPIENIAGGLNIDFIKDYLEENFRCIDSLDVSPDYSVLNHGKTYISMDNGFLELGDIHRIISEIGINENEVAVVTHHTVADLGADTDKRYQFIAIAIDVAPVALQLLISMLKAKTNGNIRCQASDMNIPALIHNLSEVSGINQNDLNIQAVNKLEKNRFSVLISNRYKTFQVEASANGKIINMETSEITVTKI